MLFKMESRKATDKDFATVCRFPRSARELFYMYPQGDFPLTEEQLAAVSAQRSDPTVVLCDGKVAGYANFYDVAPGNYCAIGNAVVSPRLRGRGIGEYLIRTMERLAREKHGATEIRLSCFSTNTRGILLYTKMGYLPREVEQRTDRRGHRHALLKFAKALE